MKHESKNKDDHSQKKVINNLHRADYLLIGLPTVLAAVLLIIFPIVWSVIARANGDPTEIGGFNFNGLLIFAGIILCSIFCVGYGFLAFALSFLTRRNTTFRILLFAVPLLTISLLCFQAFLHHAPRVFMETEEIPAETEEIPVETEETPAKAGG